jgi:hypothetical protein
MPKPKLALLAMLFLVLSGCASRVSGPCDDSDPAGICANAHGHECVC